MVKGNLTKRQSDVYDFIVKKISFDNIPPSIQEICAEFCFKSTNAVFEILNALEKKGYIERTKKGVSRGIKLIGKKIENSKQDNYIVELNIAGTGSVENPLSIFLNSKSRIFVDRNYFKIFKGSHFAAFIDDDGLGKDGIKRGDLVIVSQGKALNNGDVVAVLYNDKIVARLLERYTNYDELIANVRGYPKIRVKKDDGNAVIIGKIIGLVRKFI